MASAMPYNMFIIFPLSIMLNIMLSLHLLWWVEKAAVYFIHWSIAVSRHCRIILSSGSGRRVRTAGNQISEGEKVVSP
jgi:hypothetical protein